MSRSLIINARHRLRWHQRLCSDASTVLMWGAWLKLLTLDYAEYNAGTLPPPAASVSLPLDVGTVTDVVPAHLRRAITTRDRQCAAPGGSRNRSR